MTPEPELTKEITCFVLQPAIEIFTTRAGHNSLSANQASRSTSLTTKNATIPIIYTKLRVDERISHLLHLDAVFGFSVYLLLSTESCYLEAVSSSSIALIPTSIGTGCIRPSRTSVYPSAPGELQRSPNGCTCLSIVAREVRPLSSATAQNPLVFKPQRKG